MLSDAGLVESHSVGTRNLYALTPDGMAGAQQWLVRTWDNVLAAFAAEVSRAAREQTPQQPAATDPAATDPAETGPGDNDPVGRRTA